MPTYDYACDNCGHQFEIFQNMSDEPLSECPICKETVRRIIYGGTGVIFKGGGFYVTDSKGKSPSTTSNSTPSQTEKSEIKDKTVSPTKNSHAANTEKNKS